MQNIFNKLANVFESGEKLITAENQQAYQNAFSSIVIDYVTGRRHQNYFEEGQDYSGYRSSDTRATIAVSDGCFSAKEALTAAKLSVEFALIFFQDKDWQNTGTDAASRQTLVDEFVESLHDALRASGKDYRQLCATLAVASFDKATNQYLVMSIGDSYVAAYLGESACKVIFLPFNRDGDSNRTCFGNSEDAAETAQLEIGNALEKRYTGFVVCSDGASALYDTENLSYGKRVLAAISDATRNSDAAVVHAKLMELQSQRTYDDVSIGVMLVNADAKADADKTKIAKEKKSETTKKPTNTPADLADVSEEYDAETDTIPEPLRAKLEQTEVPTMVGILIVKLFIKYQKLTTQELIELGICKPGKVLSTMLPFIQADILIYQDDTFILKQTEA